MQWIDGVKLTTLPKAEIRALVKVRSWGRERRIGGPKNDREMGITVSDE